MVKKYKKLYNLVNPFPVVYIIKLFWRKSGNSRFPLKPLVQEYDILKEINSYWVKFCLKIALFSHFCAGSGTNYIQCLNFGLSRFPPTKFYNINYWGSEFLSVPHFSLNPKWYLVISTNVRISIFFECIGPDTKWIIFHYCFTQK